MEAMHTYVMNSTKYDSMFKGNWKTKIVQLQRSFCYQGVEESSTTTQWGGDELHPKDMRRFSHGNMYIDSENL